MPARALRRPVVDPVDRQPQSSLTIGVAQIGAQTLFEHPRLTLRQRADLSADLGHGDALIQMVDINRAQPSERFVGKLGRVLQIICSESNY
jgi:hypothetical protein